MVLEQGKVTRMFAVCVYSARKLSCVFFQTETKGEANLRGRLFAKGMWLLEVRRREIGSGQLPQCCQGRANPQAVLALE